MRTIDLRDKHPHTAAKLIAQLRMDTWNLERFNNMNRYKLTEAELEDCKSYVENAFNPTGTRADTDTK